MEINNRIDMIMHHPLFVEAMKIIEEAEEHRIYCKHGFDHCLDVARICYIMSKEACCTLEKDVIYAAAFLHDIGRSKEYTEGTSHEEAGVGLARQILADSFFSALKIPFMKSENPLMKSAKPSLLPLLYELTKNSV